MKSVKKTAVLSGHFQLFAVPLNNIFSLSGQTLTLKNDTDIYELVCSNESIQLASPSEYSKPGGLYRHKITGFVPGRSLEADLILEEMTGKRFMIILQNADGNFTRTGETHLGLSFQFEYSTSPDPSGSNGYSFSFSGALLTGQRPVSWPLLVNS
jgi:hypothetical protein